MDPKDLKPGQIYNWVDTISLNTPTYEITIVGIDPRTGNWVASCKQWALELSYLDEEDFEVMQLVQDAQEIRHWMTY